MSKGKLYPLAMRPGIKRDGSPFQSEYCTAGDWVRWQKGLPRAMGGMAGVGSISKEGLISDIMIINTNQNLSLIIFGISDAGIAIRTGIQCMRVDDDFVPSPNTRFSLSISEEPNIIWQSTIVQRGKLESADSPAIPVQPYLFYYGCPNAVSVANSNGAALNLAVPTATLLNAAEPPSLCMQPVLQFDAPNPANADGGMCYAAPYLFLYGSNGSVRVSKASDCFDFRTKNLAAAAAAGAGAPPEPAVNVGGDVAQEYTLPTGDKVVCGYQTRGGNVNSPTLLFWTLSSVTRLSFIPDDSTFKTDVVSTSSTILSGKCVVEYDGIFYWVGTDRFYIYNGVVNTLPNTLSSDYFFNNLNKAASSVVFGVRFPRFNEIWWFYPSGRSKKCNRVLIYNVLEKSWYDVILSRTCGIYSPKFGSMITCGLPKTNLAANFQNAFLHEKGINETGQGLTPQDIPRFFTTPFFSFAAFSPLKQQVGEDNVTLFQRLEPDFITNNPIEKPCIIDVTITTYSYALSQTVRTILPQIKVLRRPSLFPIPIITPGQTEKLDNVIQGGHMQLTFLSTDLFEMGHNMIKLNIGDGRR